MKQNIKTLQLHHLEKKHRLKNDLLIVPVAELFTRFDLKKHWRNRFYGIFMFKEASGSVVIDNQLYELGENRMLFLNYNQVYYFNPSSEPEGYAILFTKSFYNYIYTGNKLIRSDTALADLPPITEMNASFKKEFHESLQNIKKEYSGNKLYGKEIICMQLKIFILQFIRASAGQNELPAPADHKKETVEKFSELVNLFYKEFKTTAPYAEKLNLTPNYLNTLVKDQLAMSAGNYIRNRVILEAERLLLHTTLSVTEISYELGFTDNSHFGKYFKSANAMSPNQYRALKKP